jgi:hypothetical protein
VTLPDDKLDEALRSVLADAGDDEPVDVLVYPASSPAAVERYLADRQGGGWVRYNVLSLHGSIAVRARRPAILELAAHPDVARITTMPAAGIS